MIRYKSIGNSALLILMFTEVLTDESLLIKRRKLSGYIFFFSWDIERKSVILSEAL